MRRLCSADACVGEACATCHGTGYSGRVLLAEWLPMHSALRSAVLQRSDGPFPDEAELRVALQGFVGEIEQLPPMYSAVKQGGVPLHRLARQGRVVERASKTVTIERLELVKYSPPELFRKGRHAR